MSKVVVIGKRRSKGGPETQKREKLVELPDSLVTTFFPVVELKCSVCLVGGAPRIVTKGGTPEKEKKVHFAPEVKEEKKEVKVETPTLKCLTGGICAACHSKMRSAKADQDSTKVEILSLDNQNITTGPVEEPVVSGEVQSAPEEMEVVQSAPKEEVVEEAAAEEVAEEEVVEEEVVEEVAEEEVAAAEDEEEKVAEEPKKKRGRKMQLKKVKKLQRLEPKEGTVPVGGDIIKKKDGKKTPQWNGICKALKQYAGRTMTSPGMTEEMEALFGDYLRYNNNFKIISDQLYYYNQNKSSNAIRDVRRENRGIVLEDKEGLHEQIKAVDDSLYFHKKDVEDRHKRVKARFEKQEKSTTALQEELQTLKEKMMRRVCQLENERGRVVTLSGQLQEIRDTLEVHDRNLCKFTKLVREQQQVIAQQAEQIKALEKGQKLNMMAAYSAVLQGVGMSVAHSHKLSGASEEVAIQKAEEVVRDGVFLDQLYASAVAQLQTHEEENGDKWPPLNEQ